MTTITEYMLNQITEAYRAINGTNHPHGLTRLLHWHTSELQQFWLQLQRLDEDHRVDCLLDVIYQMRV